MSAIRTPSILLSAVLYGLIRREYHRPSRAWTSRSTRYAVNLVLGGLVRSHSEGVPQAVPSLDLSFHQAAFAAYFRDQAVEVGHINVGLEIADRPAHIRGDQVQQRFRRGREAPDSPVATHDDHRDAHSDK